MILKAKKMEKNYSKLLIIQVISFVIMYLVMFLNVNSIDHIYLSVTRFYMAILMVSPMALEVQKLAESIIKAQEEEIAQMKAALERLEK